jgi:glycosyltransferase involved in cell wall biosynthesis
MTRTRVLRIITRMNVGGPALHVTLLADGLDANRYETCLLTGATDETEGDYLDLTGRRVPNLIPVPALGRAIALRQDVPAYRHLARIIRTFRPDIVHTHTAKAGLLGRLAAYLNGVGILVHTFHGHVLRGYFSRPKQACFVQAERALARATTRLIAVSGRVREELLAMGVGRPDRFDVVPLGFDLSAFLQDGRPSGGIRRALGLSPTTPTVGIVARLVPIKAHEVFLDMAADVAAARPDVAFLVVGDGERRQDLEAAARSRGLGSRVHFLGWRADIDRVYADLDVVVLTSRNEGSPVALIEAMAAARPVVATRVGGVGELVGDSGLLTDVDDARALALGVRRLLDDRAMAARLGQRGRSRVVPAFSRERLVADIDALYQRLLAERRDNNHPGR